MNIEQIVTKVEDFNANTNYWFVRTDYGNLFESFIEEKYIAIGWDYVSHFDLRSSNRESIILRIAQNGKLNLETQGGKSKATTIYNKLLAFANLKKNDIVIIPSKNSKKLAFGRIMDDTIYDEVNAKNYIKRRKVEWFKNKPINHLNSKFFEVKSNQHTISNINRFSSYIDRVIGSLYTKDNKTHFVLNVEKNEDISFEDLNNLMLSVNSLIKNINTELQFNENLDDFYIKINLQSRGSFELIKSGSSLAILAFLLHCASCNTLDNIQDQNLQNLVNNNRDALNRANSAIDSLNINTDELTQPFRNGN